MKRRTVLLGVGAGVGTIGGCLSRSGAASVGAELRSLDVSAETRYPTHEYHFGNGYAFDDPTQVEGKDPVAFDALDAELQPVIRQIITEDRPVGLDDPPAGLIDTVEQHVVSCPGWCTTDREYVELTYAEIDWSARPALALDAEITSDRTGLHLTLRNTSDRPQEVASAVGAPFGPLKAVGTGETDRWFHLWSDFYEEEGAIRVENGEIRYGDAEDLMTVSPSETVTRTYECSTRVADEFRPGEYVLSPYGDGAEHIFGEETDVPFMVRYAPIRAQPTEGPPETTDLEMQYMDFRIRFELGNSDDI